MRSIKDFKIKHLSALVSQEIGKSVSIVSISIDPFGPYYFADEDGEIIDESEHERCIINWSELGDDFGRNCHSGFFIWFCDDEELSFEFEMEDEGMSDFSSYNWAGLHDDEVEEGDMVGKGNVIQLTPPPYSS